MQTSLRQPQAVAPAADRTHGVQSNTEVDEVKKAVGQVKLEVASFEQTRLAKWDNVAVKFERGRRPARRDNGAGAGRDCGEQAGRRPGRQDGGGSPGGPQVAASASFPFQRRRLKSRVAGTPTSCRRPRHSRLLRRATTSPTPSSAEHNLCRPPGVIALSQKEGPTRTLHPVRGTAWTMYDQPPGKTKRQHALLTQVEDPKALAVHKGREAAVAQLVYSSHKLVQAARTHKDTSGAFTANDNLRGSISKLSPSSPWPTM